MNTPDSRAEVFDFYHEALDQAPWSLSGVVDLEDADTSFINFFRLDDPSVSGTVTIQRLGEDGEATQITIVLPPPPASPVPSISPTPSPTATEEG